MSDIDTKRAIKFLKERTVKVGDRRHYVEYIDALKALRIAGHNIRIRDERS